MIWSLMFACTPSDNSPLTYQVTWQDTFDGTELSRDNWELQVGGNGWGNNQLEHNTDREDNVRVSGDGSLQIIAREEAYQGNLYTSGRIRSQRAFPLIGSRFEAKIRMPAGQGLWPAFWLLGDTIEEEGWPLCGEIDIMEFRGELPHQFLTTVHGPGYSGGASVGSLHTMEDDLSADFHVYAVEIDSEYIAWYIDNERVYELGIGDVNGSWVFDGSARIILNLAVGGNFLLPPNDETPFPSTLEVEWVQYWQRGTGTL
ncbi:MAG: glycoside hydrolase family 16 protein [Myxococcota bacterium]|nr:glycoside hydrolase family 16 protein [Myxococcota bacterium]